MRRRTILLCTAITSAVLTTGAALAAERRADPAHVQIPICAVKVVLNPGTAGSVTRSPDQPSYQSGTSVTLTAVPAPGSVFKGWSGHVQSTDNPVSFMAGGDDMYISANFETDCAVWAPLAAFGPPPGRIAPAVIFDPTGDRMFLFAGSANTDDTWFLSLNGFPPYVTGVALWRRPQIYGPSSRHKAATIFDPVRNRMIVVGGGFGESSCALSPVDVWALELNGTQAWSQILPAGNGPTHGSGCAAIYDPVRDRLILFGGASGCVFSETHTNEVWALNLSGTPSWTLIVPSGVPPAPRAQMASAYDPVGDRMVIVGGLLGGHPYSPPVFSENDVWTLTLSGTPQWTRLEPAGTPPSPRWAMAGCYDPAQERLLVFGGTDAALQTFGDFHALSLGGTPAWSEVATSGGPAWSLATLMHDPARGRFMLFGPGTQPYVIDLDGFAFACAVDPPGSGAVIRSPNEVCVSGTPVTLTATPAPGFAFSSWSGDVSGLANPVTIAVGHTTNVTANFVRVVGAEPGAGTRFGLAMSPNPSFGSTKVTFELPAEGRARVTVHDLAGREVSCLVDGHEQPGRHILDWNPRGAPGRLTAGVYFARVEFGGRVVSRKFVLME